MNQQLLNINTVFSSGQYKNNNTGSVDTSMGMGMGMGTGMDTGIGINITNQQLDHITSIVNDNANDNASRGLKYRITRFLGRGINGNLYLAVDGTGRRVICKEIMLDTNPSNNAMQTRQLEFELALLKYLSSNEVAREHVNPCLDYKIHNKMVYTIFPVFNGYSLGHFYGYMSRLQQQADYFKIAFYLAKSLLHALAKIHETGIAHQNITDGSILVSTFNEPREIKVKLTDFGLGCGNVGIGIGTEMFKRIGNCRDYGAAPVKFTPDILQQMKDADFLKVSQKYDILCLGVILLRFLLYFDSQVMSAINTKVNTVKGITNSRVEYIRNLIKEKYLNAADRQMLDMLSLPDGEKRRLLQYLKLIWRGMLCPTVKRRSAQYILDKIIIYEKYKNDIF